MTSNNGRPKLLASDMDVNAISLPDGRRPRLVCADCGSWQEWVRGMISAHPLPPPGDVSLKCPGSHQLVDIDITAEQLRERRATAVAHVRAIARGSRGGRQQAPPTVPAVHQIAAKRARREAVTPT